jgi:hypothetical protein
MNAQQPKPNALVEHLRTRGMNPQDYTSVHVDNDAWVVTLMLYAPATGKLVGCQTYRPFAPKTSDELAKTMSRRMLRYFTETTGDELAVWGVETLDRPGPVYLVEGVFDAVKLHSLGLACLAVLGNGAVPKRGVLGSPLQNQLRAMNRRVVGVLDNDKAGQALAELCDEVFVCEVKDPGEMTLEELKEFLCL